MIIDSHIQMPFHSIGLNDLWWYKAKEKEDDIQACDSVFGSIFLWASAYHTEVAKIAGCAVARYYFHGQKLYSYPIGGTDDNKKVAVETLLKLANANEEKLCLTILSEKQLEHANRYFYGIFEIDGDRSRYDYVYEADKLRTLKGKKLSAKRNHINRFVEKYQWEYEVITADNLEQCWAMEEEWFDIRAVEPGAEIRELEAEKKAIRLALDHYEELQFTGGILKADGKVVAFTLGEKLNAETMVVHFEKAYPDIQGAFQMINQQFVINNCADCKYINREEDTGDPGLRKAKMSYYPDYFAKKYYAVESEFSYATRRDTDDIIALWKDCFGDEDSYIRFYLDNRFTEDNMLCVREEGKIVSMISLLPTTLCYPADVQSMTQDELRHSDDSQQTCNPRDAYCIADAYYVYAVATSPSCRRKGYASKLIKHAFHKWKKPLILQHASESLEGYYAEQGFIKCFKRYLYDYAAGDLTVATNDISDNYEIIYEITDEVIADYMEKREAFFANRPFISWDRDAIAYALRENAFCGGYMVKTAHGYLLCRIENGAVRIVESLIHFNELASDFWQEILQKLCEKDSCHILWVHNRGGMLLAQKDLKEQATTWGTSGYLGLTLD